ncbi:helix-turn-helix domain-containing protein [Idiomarina xiamenensis]|uniref:Bacteriophage CI repressor n=1 Tax=Idiomarina xiamenensis 10-D-4 TaxID=740709 RepID=K2JXG9_9GAMM|nr:helix-turn-helix domain-containing protein [Idiomarina xiamenensis]EKE79312.1 hypothetical protein A10D4_13066 [Idiomarina xiamenensis 10-D-4]
MQTINIKPDINRPLNQSRYLTLHQCIERLKLVSGETRVAGLMRWMGVNKTSYANWRRRETIPYGAIVKALLRHGISLDWFFAPEFDLHYPTPDQLSGVNEQRLHYDAQRERTLKVIVALEAVEPVLRRNGLAFNEKNRETMLETYFAAKHGFVPLQKALIQTALALKVVQPRSSTRR